MINIKLLRNLYKKDIQDYLKKIGYKGVENATKGESWNDYEPLLKFVNKELSKEKSLLNSKVFNDFIYEQIFSKKFNLHYITNLTSLLGFKDSIKLSDVKDILENNNLKPYPQIILADHKKNNELCLTTYNTYIEDGIEFLSSLQIIIYLRDVEVNRGTTYMYCCVDIDVVNKFVSIKHDGYLLHSESYSTETVDEVLGLISSFEALKPLKITTSMFNQAESQSVIQKLFIELSEQAEILLQQNTNKDTEQKVRAFLIDIGVPDEEDYVKQIISVAYQNISKTFSKEIFKEGWAFRFVFREGDNTRASSNNTDQEPVYSKKVYWNLKELMFKEKGTDFIEAGLLWNTQNGKSPVIIRLEQKNGYLVIQYYKKSANEINRREKEKYVLRKIREKL